MTVALLDWGIGGLSVYRQLAKARPDIDFVYLSDSGSMPYGKMTKKELIQRLNDVSDFFRKKQICQIVIACNAASTVLDEVKKKNPDLNYLGMLDSGARMIEASKAKNSLILGGFRTIRSKYFQTHFKHSKIIIQAKVAQPLSGFIEQGDMQSEAFITSLTTVLSNLNFKPRSILLACTHYPAITSQIQKIFPRAKILDPSYYVVRQLSLGLKKADRKGSALFFTTGNSKLMRRSGHKAFGIDIHKVQKVRL